MDPSTNTVVARVAVPAGPDWFAVGAGVLWVTMTDAGKALRIDPAGNNVAVQVSVGPRPLDPAIVDRPDDQLIPVPLSNSRCTGTATAPARRLSASLDNVSVC